MPATNERDSAIQVWGYQYLCDWAETKRDYIIMVDIKRSFTTSDIHRTSGWVRGCGPDKILFDPHPEWEGVLFRVRRCDSHSGYVNFIAMTPDGNSLRSFTSTTTSDLSRSWVEWFIIHPSLSNLKGSTRSLSKSCSVAQKCLSMDT